MMKDFDYCLPKELIAQYPPKERTASRLMVCDRADQTKHHITFSDIDKFLNPGDLLVFNDTRVISARLFARLQDQKIEIFLVRQLAENEWECLAKPAKLLKQGTSLKFNSSDHQATVVQVREHGLRVLHFTSQQGISFHDFLKREGKVPLPPYISREPESQDQERYQTVYAKQKGAVAAPTAGLHFTRELIAKLEQKGVETAFITLHVGLGTFRPVGKKEWIDKKLHPETYEISEGAAHQINKALESGRRVIAVGTTSVRALESAAMESFPLKAGRKETTLFIYPPHDFKVIQGMITNFHLPQSSLLMLVAAFAGKELVSSVYQEAIQKKYRFYSYGDALFLY